MLRSPASLSRRSVAFATRYPTLRLSFRSRRSSTPNRGPGAHTPVPSSGWLTRGNDSGSPRFLENPFVPLPCSSTPAGPSSQAVRDVGTAPAVPTTKAPTMRFLSGLHSTASGLTVYASSSGSPHPTQNSLPAAGPALPVGIGYPKGSSERFPSCFLHLIPLSQASPGAKTSQFLFQIRRKRRWSVPGKIDFTNSAAWWENGFREASGAEWRGKLAITVIPRR